VVAVDLTMPGRGGLEGLHELKRLCPSLPVLVLSMHPEDQFAVRVLRAGGAGYLTKESAPQELVHAIRTIWKGGKYISPNTAELLATHLQQHGDSDQPLHDSLSDRENQVFRLIAAGHTLPQRQNDQYLPFPHPNEAESQNECGLGALCCSTSHRWMTSSVDLPRDVLV
jgi:two-component system invasion response regulator UvrY